MVKIIQDLGTDMDHPIIIMEAMNSVEGVRAEYEYLGLVYGKKDVDYKLIIQKIHEKNGKKYDEMEIELKDKTNISVFFDISDFFGKGLSR